MPKYYVESGSIRLVLTADDAEQAAIKAFQWSCDRQAEVYSEPVGDLIRDAEAMEYMLDDQIQVNETGFDGSGESFDLLDIAAEWPCVTFR
jgi:hypothetical protein